MGPNGRFGALWELGDTIERLRELQLAGEESLWPGRGTRPVVENLSSAVSAAT